MIPYQTEECTAPNAPAGTSLATLMTVTGPRCHTRLLLEDRPSAPLSDPVAHALVDHLLCIETELATIRRLLVEEMLR
jgi:hypothetical protein